jgi:hypothetical protein
MKIKNRADWRNSNTVDQSLGVPRFEFDSDIYYPQMFRDFSKSLQENSGIVPQLGNDCFFIIFSSNS